MKTTFKIIALIVLPCLIKSLIVSSEMNLSHQIKNGGQLQNSHKLESHQQLKNEKNEHQNVQQTQKGHHLQAHQYWFNKNHPTDFILSSARQWNYCDQKCLYLQKLYKNKDFVVVVMGGLFKQDFSACYVKNGQEYTLWKQIITNKFFEQNCGQDSKDWMKSGDFNIKGIYGVGIGTELDEKAMYQ